MSCQILQQMQNDGNLLFPDTLIAQRKNFVPLLMKLMYFKAVSGPEASFKLAKSGAFRINGLH